MREYPFNFDSSSINFESSHLLLNILQIGILGELMHVCVGLEAWVVSQVNRHDVIVGGYSRTQRINTSLFDAVMAKIDSFEVSIANFELSRNLEGRSIAKFVLRKVQEFQTQRGSVNFLIMS